MSSENETVEDIVREMRQVGPYPIYKKPIFTNPKSVSESYLKRFMYGQLVTDYGTVIVENPKVKNVSNCSLASRIESAWRREKTELCECLRLSSNAMEMVRQFIRTLPNWRDNLEKQVKRNRKAIEVANATVAERGAK